MIRAAKHADIPAIVELAVQSVLRDPLPVKIDREAMSDTVRSLVGNPAHFCWVTADDSGVTGCVAAVVQPSFWFKGLQASVLLYYATEAGSVAKLMREFARWVKSRSAIKLAIVELEPATDPRMANFLARIGFARKSANMTYVKGAL